MDDRLTDLIFDPVFYASTSGALGDARALRRHFDASDAPDTYRVLPWALSEHGGERTLYAVRAELSAKAETQGSGYRADRQAHESDGYEVLGKQRKLDAHDGYDNERDRTESQQ